MQDSVKIPRLYAQEKVPELDKAIFQRWQIQPIHFNWLIAEVDEQGKIAFGFAYLNNWENAEWGYVDLDELRKAGATLDEAWDVCTFSEAINRLNRPLHTLDRCRPKRGATE